MPVIIQPYHEVTVPVEGGEIRLHLARMNPPQWEAFRATFEAMGKGHGDPGETPTENETPEAAKTRLAGHLAFLEDNARWTVETFRQYVKVVDGDLIVGDGEVVTDGARFAELYAAEASHILSELYLRNGLPGALKKKLESQLGSGTGSTTASSLAAAGPTPATIAAAAVRKASAPLEGATGSNGARSSGTTGRSSSRPARSGRSRRKSTTSSDCSTGAMRAAPPAWRPPVGSGRRGRKGAR